MMRIIQRRFIPALILVMLLSLVCPTFAMAEMRLTEGPDMTETTEKTEEPADEITEPVQEQTPVQEDSAVEEAVEEVEQPPEEPVAEAAPQEPAVQEQVNTGAEAATAETDVASATPSGEQPKQENSSAGIQSADGTVAKAAAGPISTGSLSAADGTKKVSRAKTNAEIFISAKGSDETGNGTFEAPFASIPAALVATAGMGVDAELCLLSNLSVTGTVQILGQNVYLTSNEGAFTITRDDSFALDEEGLNTAMFAVGSPDTESGAGGQLILEHVVLNEKGVQTEPLQDAMITVNNGGKLILGEETMLLNYGGESAVHACSGSEVSLAPTAWILNDMQFEADDTVAILEEEGSTVMKEAGCIVLSHGEVWELEEAQEQPGTIDGEKEKEGSANSGGNANTDDDGEALPEADQETEDGNEPKDGNDQSKDQEDEKADISTAEEAPKLGTIHKKGTLANSNALQAAPSLQASSSLGFKLEAPESVAKDDKSDNSVLSSPGTVVGYLVPYTLSLNLGSVIGGIGEVTADAVQSVTVSISLTLDSRLYPEMKVVDTVKVLAFEPGFPVKEITSSFDSSTHTIDLEVVVDQAENLQDTLSLRLNTVLPSADYPGTEDKLTGTAELKSATVAYQGGTWSPTLGTLSASAETKLLGIKTATLVYNPNGGSGGPGEQKLPAETGHRLETSNVPTHSKVNGVPVLFYGWALEKDQKIYADGDSKPETVSALSLADGETVNVYAVYSYDRNNDDVPDVDQKLLTLGFDANGGSGAPAQMIKAAVSGIAASFDIPQKEPTRKYYTFLGWSEDEDATEAKYKYDAAKKAYRDITISKDTCLYAVWEENPVYTLYFNGNGGSNVPAAQSARSDNGVAAMTITKQVPTRAGRTFVGWSTQRYGTAAFDPGEDVRLTGGDVTLFAVWERNGSSSGRAPKTGDESHVALYAALTVGSAAALAGLAIAAKKRRK